MPELRWTKLYPYDRDDNEKGWVLGGRRMLWTCVVWTSWTALWGVRFGGGDKNENILGVSKLWKEIQCLKKVTVGGSGL